MKAQTSKRVCVDNFNRYKLSIKNYLSFIPLYPKVHVKFFKHGPGDGKTIYLIQSLCWQQRCNPISYSPGFDFFQMVLFSFLRVTNIGADGPM